MKLTAAGLSDVGRERDHNEDSYAVEDDLGLYIVCDGMGGHQAGEIASALADPTSDIAKGVNGTANTMTAQICKLTGQQPTAVCTAPGVVAAAATLK